MQVDIPRVKRNIGRLIEQGAPEADIDAYLASENVTTEMLRGPSPGKGLSKPGREDWTPKMRDAYTREKSRMDQHGWHDPFGERMIQSATLGGADEAAALVETIAGTPAALISREPTTFSGRFNENWAAKQPGIDAANDASGGIVADIVGGVGSLGPGTAVNALAAAAPKAFELSKDLIKYGAAFGGAHAGLSAEGDVLDRLSYVPEGAAFGAAGSLVVGHGVNKLAQMAAKNTQAGQVRAQENLAREKTLADAGVEDPLGAAVAGSDMSQRFTTGVGGTIVGGPIRDRVTQNIRHLDDEFTLAVRGRTGGASSDDLGQEVQDTLRQQLTGRSIESDDVARMTPEQLQDVSGLPLPEKYRPEPPRVEPVAAEDVAPVTPEAYLDTVRSGIADEVPTYGPQEQPRPINVDDFEIPRETIVEPKELAAKRAELEQLEASALQTAPKINEETDALARELKNAGYQLHTYNNGDFYLEPTGMLAMSRPRLEYYKSGRPSRVAENAEAWKETKAAIRGVKNPNYAAQNRYVSPYASTFASNRQKVDGAVQRYLNLRTMNEEAQQSVQRIRDLKSEIADLEAGHKAAVSESAVRAQEAQREAYARAVSDEAERVRVVNENARKAAEAEASLRTERAREAAVDQARPRAQEFADAQTEALRAKAASDARERTRVLQDEANAKFEKDMAEREARLSKEGNPLGASREHTYVTEADTAYEMARRHTPPIQRNPLGTNGRPTETSRLLESLVKDAVSAQRMAGFKGSIYDGKNGFHPRVQEMFRRDFGAEIANTLNNLAIKRNRNQLPPGLRGLHDIKTAVGSEVRDAGRYREPGMPAGANHASLQRLYKALSNDIDNIRNTAPDGEHATAMRQRIDRNYSKLLEGLRRPLGQLFKDNVTPVQALDKLVRGAQSGDLSLLRPYMRVMRDKSDPEKAAATIIGHMTRNKKDIGAILEEFGKIPSESRDILFQGNTQYRQSLERLEKAWDLLKPYAPLAKQKTGARGAVMQTLRPSTIIGAAGLYHQFVPALIVAGGAAAVARFLGSPRYVRWLTKIPRTKGGKFTRAQSEKIIARLSALTSKDGEFGELILSTLGDLIMPNNAYAGPKKSNDPYEGPGRLWTNYKHSGEVPDDLFSRALVQVGFGLDHPEIDAARRMVKERGPAAYGAAVERVMGSGDYYTDSGLEMMQALQHLLQLDTTPPNPDGPDYTDQRQVNHLRGVGFRKPVNHLVNPPTRPTGGIGSR